MVVVKDVESLDAMEAGGIGELELFCRLLNKPESQLFMVHSGFFKDN